MDITYNKNIKKKIVKKAGLIFVSIVVLLTFFSKTINNLLLPEVEYTFISRGSLKKNFTAAGEVESPGKEKVYAEAELKITDIKVKEGDKVSKGTVLALADKDEMRLTLKSKELELIRTENEYERLKNQSITADDTDNTEKLQWLEKDLEEAEAKLEEAKLLYENGLEDYKGIQECQKQVDSVKSEIKALQQKKDEGRKSREDYERSLNEKNLEIQIKRMEYENFKNKFSSNGEIKSETEGVVGAVKIEKGLRYGSGQLLFEIHDKDSKLEVRWRLNTAKAALLKEGDMVDIKISGEEKATVATVVKTKSYSPDDGMYIFTSPFNTKADKLKGGQQVDMNITKISKEYPVIVSAGCVMQVGGGRSILFVLKEKEGVMGLEYYVKSVEVEVVDSDGSDTAISAKAPLAENDRIISFASKVLADGVRVKMR